MDTKITITPEAETAKFLTDTLEKITNGECFVSYEHVVCVNHDVATELSIYLGDEHICVELADHEIDDIAVATLTVLYLSGGTARERSILFEKKLPTLRKLVTALQELQQ